MTNGFGGNQGNQGPQGNQGNQGNQGPQGYQGGPQGGYPPHYPQQQPKSPMGGILAGLVVLLLGAVAFLLYDRFAGNDSETEPAVAEADNAATAAPTQQAAAPAAAPAPSPTPTPTASAPSGPPPVQLGQISKDGLSWHQTKEPIETNVVGWGSKLRAIPSDAGNSQIVGSIAQGAPVKVLATTDVTYLQAPWHFVEANGKRGYVSGDFLCAPNGADPNMFFNDNNCQ